MSAKEGRILIIDDDEDVLMTARMILRPHFSHIYTEKSPKKLLRTIADNPVDVIILDMNFQSGATSGNEGLFWLREILKTDPLAHVIMNTAYGDIPLAVESMKIGAIDFLSKPWEREKLLSTVKNVYRLRKSALRIRKLDETRKTLSGDLAREQGELIGDGTAMEQLRKDIRKVAKTDANVLILGENGTGKDLVARQIHAFSNRSEETFIKVDLGSLNPQLISSELFGHVKGAFTDAREDRTGRFELASGGTVFLDEIGNIPVDVQAKLLSVLQNREIFRVGDAHPIPVDIRLISATNMPLYDMVESGKFRQDLMYRINTIEIVVPPLRDRSSDIPQLANHFLKIYKEKYRKPQLRISSDSLEHMNSYDWPGNVREMQHAIERAVIMTDQQEIGPSELMLSNRKVPSNSLKTLNVDEIEKEAIIRAIDKHDGNLSHAARELGMGRTTLYRKISKYNLKSDK